MSWLAFTFYTILLWFLSFYFFLPIGRRFDPNSLQKGEVASAPDHSYVVLKLFVSLIVSMIILLLVKGALDQQLFSFITLLQLDSR
jgi:predicted secreted protein